MNLVQPATPAELAQSLAEAAGRGQTIRLGGNFTKDKMAGPLASGDVSISTRGLRSVLRYESRDLTISVEAGLPYAEFRALLPRRETGKWFCLIRHFGDGYCRGRDRLQSQRTTAAPLRK